MKSNKRRKKDLSRAPKPYEVVKDALQIETNIMLTSVIIVLVLIQTALLKDYPLIRDILIFVISILIAIIIIDAFMKLRKFKKEWVDWVKKGYDYKK
ncbi:MAG: hypothetical protein ACE5J4_00955 [Candidatus Aenigmatarchaeota archaeon]